MPPNCPKCDAQPQHIRKFGRFFRKSDFKWIQRYFCNSCQHHFSQASFSICYRQNKRRLNTHVRMCLCSLMSQRRFAKSFGVSRSTVKRKLQFLAKIARQNKSSWQYKYKGTFTNIQFDDQETFEHTKCKPLSVTVVVDVDTRKIIDYTVAQIPAKGHLAKISRKKYGRRQDHSRAKRRQLFKKLKGIIHQQAEFHTDKHVDYPLVLNEYFPKARHFTYKRKEGCVTGQGELKKTSYDPIFIINHTLAMIRANINRLVRKTWCTTKKLSALDDHLAIYVDYHNKVLV